ncbi:YceI family protein [Longimicrobium sp.]|uniref:YceI family protein n=1 Tax=Longimicrobium sp. TaxID=2029185 RepID=UPI002BB42E0F|nr:YceI family protein [Longimicrobium sp.]HSU13692.1 YceI family protein [Longimicrobium sp.]
MRKSLVLGSMLVVPVLAAASLAPLSMQPGSRVWVDGTSTTRSWHCESTHAVGSAAASTTDLAQLANVGSASVTVPVATLDCRNNTMNGHMRNALKAAEAPEIRFRATSVKVNATGADAGTAEMAGTLSIAGQERPVTINATVARENGQVRVRGSKRITMTEWGVRPPSLMLGTMKVAPAATVGFDVVLKP